MTGWLIAAGELRIPWRSSLAAHRMVLVVNERGEVVRQFNGLASYFDVSLDRWRHKPIGFLRSDRLRGYDTNSHPQTWMPMHGVLRSSRDVRAAIENGHVVPLLGTKTSMQEGDIDSALVPGLDVLRRINGATSGPDGGAGMRYPFLGFGRNSNSFFSTLVSAMGLPEPQFASRARIVPGAGRLLLPDREIVRIRDRISETNTLQG